ncbi:DUF4249 domain-containing protein [Hymenobacter fodinae]|uniref:DUF4249 domain-containing protein n=1 Tax=Hymenobacter fodinae TaxID=2510796 RepID=A0A4Z0PC74_9BACT|nr:DUF4249 domain-containing protein [Hymenobacter fodinae]TGE10244.1 DUF4249 domain-containing protein [Hymenobacter fodinae]
MNRHFFTCIALVSGLYFFSGCVESFEPKVAVKDSNVLVVDGSINGKGVSTIRLKRTVNLTQNGTAPVERRARMFIELQSGGQYSLSETAPGTYTSAALDLSTSQAVRLHFTLADGREYTSVYTPIKATPLIDSVSWQPTSQGLQIYVNAHDETSQSRYYRWTYDETWEFTSAYQSFLEYKNGRVVDRTENAYNCWGNEAPTAIQVGTTTRLSEDIVSQQPLTLLPSNSVKLRYKYSILVRQYALSAEEYSYWEALRKNTENIGTLFDPLPTQLTGNVHNVADASEPVIGFVGAQSVSEKRIFITHSQLPREWRSVTGYESCKIDTIPRPLAPPPTPAEILGFFQRGEVVPIVQDKQTGDYYVSTPDCVDCRRRGTNVRPSFWQ